MKDQQTSETRLLAELAEMQRRVAALEAAKTETERTLSALCERADRYRLLAEAIPQPVWHCDANGGRIESNRRWYEYTGQTPETARGFGWMTAVHPDDRAWLPERIRERVVGGQCYDAEYRLRRAADGCFRWHLARALPTKNKDGKIIGWFGSAADIHDQKQAEAELMTSRAILQATIESLPFEFFALGPDGRYMLENAVSRENWGPLIGKTPEEVATDPTVLSLWLANNRRVLGGEKVEEEAELVVKGEERFYYNVLVPILEDGQIRGVLGVNVDITRRKRAEEALRQARDDLDRRVTDRTGELAATNEALRQSEELYRTIYEGMSEGLVILDPETKRILRVNPALCHMLGYAEEELLSMSITDIHPADETAATLQRIRERAEGRLTEHRNARVLRKDGSVFYADVMGNPLTYDGRPCVLGLFRDITERQQAQAASERERQTLMHLLQASDRERQLIAYEIHDGLAQQLAGAIMQLQTYEHLKDAKPNEAAEAFDAGMTMLRQGHFEARRLISGVRPPILDEEGIVAAVSHLVNEQRRQNGPRIEFQNEVAFDRLVPILENAIYRIVQEGLANACKHSKSGRIRVELVQRGDALRIKVQDWGLGFDPAGVGEDRFGLSGIRERTRLLGGSVTIDAAPGQGTCLAVELPLLPRE